MSPRTRADKPHRINCTGAFSKTRSMLGILVSPNQGSAITMSADAATFQTRSRHSIASLHFAFANEMGHCRGKGATNWRKGPASAGKNPEAGSASRDTIQRLPVLRAVWIGARYARSLVSQQYEGDPVKRGCKLDSRRSLRAGLQDYERAGFRSLSEPQPNRKSSCRDRSAGQVERWKVPGKERWWVCWQSAAALSQRSRQILLVGSFSQSERVDALSETVAVAGHCKHEPPHTSAEAAD
jgi:hypothetical protein